MKKKYIKKANAWLVHYQTTKNKKTIDNREWFASEELAETFIKQKQNEIPRA